MNPADEIVPKRAKRQLDDAAAGPFDSLKEQLRAIVERPSRQSKPVEDLHGFDDRLDEPLRTTLKDFQCPSPWRKPEEEDELVERDDLRLGITPYPDHEVSERQANYDLSTENKKSRRSSRGFARYLVAILIGVTAALAWQSYGDVAKQMIANSIQRLGWTKPPVVERKTAPAPLD
jgi:hypothetical protein